MTKTPLDNQTLIELIDGQKKSKIHSTTKIHHFASKLNIFNLFSYKMTKFDLYLTKYIAVWSGWIWTHTISNWIPFKMEK